MKCPHCDGTGEIKPSGISAGTLILAARKAVGLTQEELAERVGLSRGQIANIELGRSDVTLKVLAKFAGALDSSMKELVP